MHGDNGDEKGKSTAADEYLQRAVMLYSISY
jgi:hypothetical protein